MAHVSRPLADRGQLLLLSALGLAALLVVLALVLNTVIYTENEAVREAASLETADLQRVQHETASVAARAVDAENEGGHRTYAAMRANLTRHLDAYAAMAASHAGRSARLLDVELVGTVDGTRLRQDASRTMTNLGGDPDWTLVADATALRSFTMTVERASLVDVGGNDSTAAALAGQDVFAVVANDGTGATRAFVYRDGPQVVVRVAAGGPLGPACRVTGPDATIDFVAGTVDGSDCAGLAAPFDPAAPTAVAYVDGDAASGTYVMVVDRPAIDGDVAPPGTPGEPSGERLVYAAYVEFDYASPGLTYAVTLTVEGASP